jgi:hypothetical protein
MTTVCTVFTEEKPCSYSTMTMRQSWPPEQLPHGIDALTTAKLPKPKGELSRLKRGGYSLKAVLAWDDEFYHKVQASCDFVCYAPSLISGDLRLTYLRKFNKTSPTHLLTHRRKTRSSYSVRRYSTASQYSCYLNSNLDVEGVSNSGKVPPSLGYKRLYTRGTEECP